MVPAVAVVAIYPLLLAWKDYLYPAVLLAVRNMTVAVTQGQLFSDTDAAWNAMMAAAIIYVLPPILLLVALRRHIATSLTRADIAGYVHSVGEDLPRISAEVCTGHSGRRRLI
jgi:multiple sugar transport system permease protein